MMEVMQFECENIIANSQKAYYIQKCKPYFTVSSRGINEQIVDISITRGGFETLNVSLSYEIDVSLNFCNFPRLINLFYCIWHSE